MDKRYIKLFANCIPVKGYSQSLIVDLQRSSSSNKIPNSLYEILTDHKDKSVEEIKAFYNNEYDDTIEEYFEFLLKNEFAFHCREEQLKSFPDIDLSWKSPSLIENAIIDIDVFDQEIIEKAISELSELRCNAIQIRIYREIEFKLLEKIGELLEGTRILSVEVFFKYSDECNIDTLSSLHDKFPRFQRIYVYRAPENIASNNGKVLFDTEGYIPDSDCGQIFTGYFSICINTFTEAQCHNTCLNRKVSINKSGEICNCPSMTNTFGNIKNKSIKEVIENPDFTKLWSINKDDIDVCKDCEYRYICTDCRAFLRDKNDIKSQPDKCRYNPYISKWEGEEGYIDVYEWRSGNRI